MRGDFKRKNPCFAWRETPVIFYSLLLFGERKHDEGFHFFLLLLHSLIGRFHCKYFFPTFYGSVLVFIDCSCLLGLFEIFGGFWSQVEIPMAEMVTFCQLIAWCFINDKIRLQAHWIRWWYISLSRFSGQASSDIRVARPITIFHLFELIAMCVGDSHNDVKSFSDSNRICCCAV